MFNYIKKTSLGKRSRKKGFADKICEFGTEVFIFKTNETLPFFLLVFLLHFSHRYFLCILSSPAL